MASRVCWQCEVKAHHTMQGQPIQRPSSEDWFAAFRCDECGVLSIGYASMSRNAVSVHSQATQALDQGIYQVHWLPQHVEGRRYDDVPPHIADAASEAHACHSIRSYRAAVLMARSVVEATAKDKGFAKGPLEKKIEAMHDRAIVRELIRDTAHEIRYIGNDMAHGDFVDPISEEDSADVLIFMGEVLNEVYQAPARLNTFRSARLASKATASE